MALERLVRNTILSLAACATVAVAACGDDDEGPSDSPEVESATLSVAGTQYAATAEDGFEVAEATVANSPFTISMSFTDPAGEPVTFEDGDLELAVYGSADGDPLPEGISFVPTSATEFRGQLSGLVPGEPVTLYLALFDDENRRNIFGPFSFTFTREDLGGGGGGEPL